MYDVLQHLYTAIWPNSALRTRVSLARHTAIISLNSINRFEFVRQAPHACYMEFLLQMVK